MKLNQIKDNSGAFQRRKIVGRGIGSGLGKTSGSGHKGQKARGSGKVALGFEGGQNPIYRRMPKRGFKNIFSKNFFVINLGRLQYFIDKGVIDASKKIDADYLASIQILNGRYDGFRVLGSGNIKAKVHIIANGYSKSALDKLNKVSASIDYVESKKKKENKKDLTVEKVKNN